jgi:hypothetical protein
VYKIAGSGMLLVADAVNERTPKARERRRESWPSTDLVRHLIDHPHAPALALTWCQEAQHEVWVALSDVRDRLRAGGRVLTVRPSGVLD